MTMTEYEELMNDTRLFYRLPKRLFEDPAFEEMSIDAKMLYMILLVGEYAPIPPLVDFSSTSYACKQAKNTFPGLHDFK